MLMKSITIKKTLSLRFFTKRDIITIIGVMSAFLKEGFVCEKKLKILNWNRRQYGLFKIEETGRHILGFTEGIGRLIFRETLY